MAETEIDAIRALLSAKPRPVGWAERRRRLDEVGTVWPVADDVKLEAVDLDGVKGEWSIVPGADASRVLMFFHGGGYCSGSIVSHRRMVTEAGRAGGLRTLAVAYRLAPEHPFPAARDDALTAWRRLLKDGCQAKHIAVGGDSAGANLTLALVGELKRAGEDLPGCLWLVSPWIDLAMSGATLVSKSAVDPLIHKEYLEELADAYAPAGHGPERPAPVASLRGSEGTAADPDPGRFGRDLARRRCPLRRRGRRGRRLRDARNLAAHDPCLAALERAPRAWPPRARARGRVPASTPVAAARRSLRLPKPLIGGTQMTGRTLPEIGRMT